MADISNKPSIADLAGIDPDFTGGQSPEDYLADIRSGGEISELRAEVERLKVELADQQQMTYLYADERNEERAEVENLNQAIEQTWRPEVKALRAEVEKWKDLVKTFSAGNVALEAEVERLKAAVVEIGAAHVAAQAEVESLKRQVFSLFDTWSQAHAEVERLRAFVQKVALFSNDSWLAQEADQIAPGAELKP